MIKTKTRKERTAADLKARAQELLKQAEELEQRQNLKAGKAARKWFEDGCKDPQSFQHELQRVFQ